MPVPARRRHGKHPQVQVKEWSRIRQRAGRQGPAAGEQEYARCEVRIPVTIRCRRRFHFAGTGTHPSGHGLEPHKGALPQASGGRRPAMWTCRPGGLPEGVDPSGRPPGCRRYPGKEELPAFSSAGGVNVPISSAVGGLAVGTQWPTERVPCQDDPTGHRSVLPPMAGAAKVQARPARVPVVPDRQRGKSLHVIIAPPHPKG